jgi:type IV fimbrial biogenesis protein FimT
MGLHRGFTLIELMATVAVAAILVTLAAPLYRDFVVRNRLVTYANDVISTVNFARSEAVRRGEPITLCPSIAGERCEGDWSDGWIAFVNTDGDSPAVVDDAEPVLRVHEALATGYTMHASPVLATHVTYRPDGSANDAGAFALCHDDDLVGARAVILTQLRPRVARDTDGDRIPNTDTGNMANCADPSAPGVGS